MSSDRFDQLATMAAGGISRRQTLKLLAGILLSGLIGSRGLRASPAYADSGCAETRVPWTPSCMDPVAKESSVPTPLAGCNAALTTAQPLVGANFLPGCDALDQCYGECGADQAACDAAFLTDMQNACLSQIPAVDAEAQIAQAICLAYALANHRLQQSVGVASYDDAQSAACDCCGCEDDSQCAEVSPELSCCSRKCVNKQTDTNNCGSCGNVCPAGQTCQDGACSCSSDSDCTNGVQPACCSGRCVDLYSDVSNCGYCGDACGPGIPCQSGMCGCDASCPAGQCCFDNNTQANVCCTASCCYNTISFISICCANGCCQAPLGGLGCCES